MSQPRFKLAPVALAAAFSLGVLASVTAGAQTVPAAATAQATYAINLKAQPLGDALNELARQAGLQLLVPRELVEGKQAPSVSGELTVRQALDRVLDGSGLAASVDGSSVVVRRAPVLQSNDAPLPTVTVTAGVERESAWGAVQGYAAKRSATGTRTDTPLIQTPLSAQVISRDVMDDQQVMSIADAVKNVSGVYVMQGPDGNTMDAFNIRGFQASSYGATYLDGVKDFSRAPKETAGLERIEVLKGPSAIMYGRIEPGGMINRVSKIPVADKFTHVQQQIGSDNYLRTSLDSNGLLSDDASWLYRINLAAEQGDGFKDHTDFKRAYVAPQIEWRPNTKTFVRTGLEYQQNDRSWAQTYGTIGNQSGPVNIPISTNLHDVDDHYKDDSLSWHLKWGHDLNENWTLSHRITYVDRNSVAKGTSLSAADSAGNYTRTYWGWEDESNAITSTNIDLVGKFQTEDIKHTLLVGADYFSENYDSGGWAFGGTPQASNVFNPNNSDAPYDLNYTINPFWYKNKNLGLFVQDQMSLLNDRLHVLVGARYDSADYTYHYGGSEFNPQDKKVTWRGGVLYQFQPNFSVYGSYVEGFGTSNYSWNTGEIFDPQTSHQYEVGVKFEPNARSSLTMSVFQLVKDNLTMADPADITRTILAGEATSKGLEIDFSGQLTDDWRVIASYAYTDVRYTKSDRFQGEGLHSIPRHGASLWSTHRFGQSGWQAGAGLTYRSERLGVQRGSQPAIYPYMMDAYTLLDLMLGYSFKLGHSAAKLQLNVNNATNKVYHPATYGSMSRIAQGKPRTIMGSLRMDF